MEIKGVFDDAVIDLGDNLFADEAGYNYYYKNSNNKLIKLPQKYFIEVIVHDYDDLEDTVSYELTDLSEEDRNAIGAAMNNANRPGFIVYSQDYQKAKELFKDKEYGDEK